MRIEITIDRKKPLSDEVEPALEEELLRRLSQKYEGCKLSIRRAAAAGNGA
ncbi:DinI-like family protein [Raoultella terrigena]|uniref:DinI-like family protein n=1 Tax=Raoultella terrigena TaxID=577 RepID=UPI003BAB641F